MNRHIYSNYPKKDIKNILLPLKKFNIDIPLEIMSKIWVYIYTCECNFYKDMNINLMKQQNIELYNSFIKMLYKGLNKKILKMNCTDKLYRCSLVSKKEIDNLKNIEYTNIKEMKDNDEINVCLVYSREFL